MTTTYQNSFIRSRMEALDIEQRLMDDYIRLVEKEVRQLNARALFIRVQMSAVGVMQRMQHPFPMMVLHPVTPTALIMTISRRLPKTTPFKKMTNCIRDFPMPLPQIA